MCKLHKYILPIYVYLDFTAPTVDCIQFSWEWATSVVMYTILHGHAPGYYLTDLFMLNNSVHDHRTSSCTTIHVKPYNTSLGQRTFA